MIKFLLSSLIAVACLVGFIVAGVGYFLLSTPRPTNIKDCLTTALFQVRLCPKEPGYANLRDISPNLRNAIVVSEDGSFYTHHGIDWFEVQESFNKNMEKGEFARGGSTITQQLAKNVYLNSEKSLLRKVREALIAVQIEEFLTKDEILEKYLNVVEFGEDLFGVTKASQLYFKKTPAQLSIAESAFLAFLLPSPKKYAVSFRKKQLTTFAHTRLREIIERLYRFKKITDAQHVQALAEVEHFYGAPATEEPAPGATPAEDEVDDDVPVPVPTIEAEPGTAEPGTAEPGTAEPAPAAAPNPTE